MDELLDRLRPYRRLLRAEKLGILDEEFTPEEARATFEAYAGLIKELEAKKMSKEEFETYIPDKSYRKQAMR